MQTADVSAEYYLMRSERERALAEAAATEEARYIHLTLSESYAKLAKEAAGRR